MVWRFRRRQPTAAELTSYAISTRDYRAAATLVVAGALEVLTEIPAEASAQEKLQSLELALGAVTS